jgi:hypothetical protein
MGLGTKLSLLLFCLLFAFRIGGYPTGFESLLYGYEIAGASVGGGLAGTTAGIPSTAGLVLLLAIFVGLFSVGGAIGTRIFSTASGSSYSVVYTIPVAMVTGFMITFLLFPMSFILDANIPLLIREFVFGILALLTILSVISFVRGVEV